jgi:hypothetical protein
MTLVAEQPVVDLSVRQSPHGRNAGHRIWFAALLAATGSLYVFGLSASGWANSFYSAAVQAGSTSWTALLFGSSDAANSITVDKTRRPCG